MKQLIKNYTTEIPVEKTIAEIQAILAQNGARGIALEYDEHGRIKDNLRFPSTAWARAFTSDNPLTRG